MKFNMIIQSFYTATVYGGASGMLILKENVLLFEKVVLTIWGSIARSKLKPTTITIKKNCWIGINSLILEATAIIEENIIIGAGAIITKKYLEKNSIYLNEYAKLIKIKDYNQCYK